MNSLLERVHEARKNEKGFTLIELLMVIVILGVLAGIVVFAVNGIQDRGKASACKADVKTVETALEAYYAKNSAYPAANAWASLMEAPNKFLHSQPSSPDYTITFTNAGDVVAAGACTQGP
ncbi:type II secretion system protein [Actinokineospora sp. HUAS TT18]|uniref:type II secretion system protein n=1 Tax=Actinokineospora sp. HUAS TT18 TaxID=3447451 RepID=UPI003F524C4B